MPDASDNGLSHAERAAMLAGVERLVRKRVAAFGVPARDRDDAAADITLKLWELTGRFVPGGKARWSTYAQCVADTMLKARRERDAAAPPVVNKPLDEAMLPGPATAGDPDEDEDEDDDDLGGHAGAVATAVRRQLAEPALACLTPGYRRLVEAVVFGGLTVDQFAEQHGQPVKVVKTNLGTALGKLALAGHVPANMAARLGVDLRALADRADGAAKKAKTAARRDLVAEELARGRTARQIAADLGEPVNTVQADARRIGRARQAGAAGAGVPLAV